MNDFSEIERQLQSLQPAKPSAGLFERLEAAMEAGIAEEKVVRPAQFRWNRFSLGAGLAAAALILLFLRVDVRNLTERQRALVAQSPVPAASAEHIPAPAIFLPAGATQVVYHTRDEGLFFPPHADEPMRKVRSATHETLQWRNAATGASLRISYPTEQVRIVPVSGQ